jgi:hypothetical protein
MFFFFQFKNAKTTNTNNIQDRKGLHCIGVKKRHEEGQQNYTTGLFIVPAEEVFPK